MKKIFFILITLNFIFTKSVLAKIDNSELERSMAFAATQVNAGRMDYRQACESLPIKPEIKFYTSYGKLQYNTNYSRENLTVLSKNMNLSEEGDLASGLALVDINYEFELGTKGRTMANKGFCIMPDTVSIYIGFKNPVIYLANDLKPDSCLYHLVVRHEQTHQQINVNALEYFIPLIYDRIKLMAKQMKPLYVNSEDKFKTGTDEMTAFYAQQINALVEEFKDEILEEQRKLDNRSNYTYESTICHLYNTKHKK